MGAEQDAGRVRGWLEITLGTAPVAAAQFLLWGLYRFMTWGTADDYGDEGGYGLILVCLCACLPVGVILAGYVHAALFTAPVVTLSRAMGRRTPMPAAGWTVVGLAAYAAAYAWPVGWALGLSYAEASAWTAAAGLLPVAAAGYAGRRGVSHRGMLVGTLWVTGVALVLAFTGGTYAANAGRLDPYRPPRPQPGDYAGEWSGSDGSRLALRGDGAATAENLSMRGGGQCSGVGRWTFAEEGAAGGARDGIALAVGGCAGPARWQVAGTTEHPELFIRLGADDVRILRRG